jgi:hypothetical protein
MVLLPDELKVLIEQLKALAGVSMYGAFKDGYIGALDVIKSYVERRENNGAQNESRRPGS